MAQNIILKRSALPGKVPTTSSLNVGEIAINTFDGRAFLHKSSSTAESIEHILITNSVTTGSITLTKTGSFGELVVTQDGNFNRDIFVTRDIVGNGDLDIAGTITASLQQGYIWVGGTGNVTKIVATSSLSSAGTNVFDSSIYVSSSQYTFANYSPSISGSNVISSIATGSYDAAFYNYILKSGSNARAGQISAVWYNGAIQYTETTTTDIGNTDSVLMAVSLNTNLVQLRAITSSPSWSIKTSINLI